MSDIDEIALDVVKAIGNIDPDKLPGGRTQALAQAQILVRDAINGEAKALQSENKALRMELDEARSKYVQNLKSFQSEAIAICQQESGEWDSDRLQTHKDYAEVCGQRIASLSLISSRAWLLRKQAEAVEAFAEWVDPHWPKSQAIMIKDDARSHAFELRQQADELEHDSRNISRSNEQD